MRSCVLAEEAGAFRAELCDNPVEGGTTPSYGTIRVAREKTSIELYPIIRPRAGSYWYTEEEFAIIREDIRMCKELGCDGISIGIQHQNGELDEERLKRVVEWAYPMGVTCNRAFDAAPDPFRSLEMLKQAGCERVLTSGCKSGAPEAADLLAQLVEAAGGDIIIMPGAGIRSSNLEALVRSTGASEYHTSARQRMPETVLYQNPEILDIGGYYEADPEELARLISICRSFDE